MIDSKKELYRICMVEKQLYFNRPIRGLHLFRLAITKEYIYYLWKYVYFLRYCEFHANKNRLKDKVLLVYYRRKKNMIGLKLGIEIHENSFDEGLLLYHGNIVVNSKVRAGRNIRLHGMNCLGNNGKTAECPVLSDNIELGVGSMILGGVSIHSGTIVGANSVVVSSTVKEGTVLVGSPAKVSDLSARSNVEK